jgi:hypothetical protein
LKRALDLGTGRTCSTMHHEPFIFFVTLSSMLHASFDIQTYRDVKYWVVRLD